MLAKTMLGCRCVYLVTNFTKFTTLKKPLGLAYFLSVFFGYVRNLHLVQVLVQRCYRIESESGHVSKTAKRNICVKATCTAGP